nr:thymidylate synthase [Encephalitozoon cuniculi]
MPQDPRHPEHQYLDLVKHILENGARRMDRTGTGALSVFGATMRFSLEDNTFPLLTTRRVFYRGVVEELLFFLRGETDSKVLEKKGVRIWEKNGAKQFLQSVGIDREEGDLGPIYGFQWRHFGARYETSASSYEGKGVDQIASAIAAIRANPASRRIVVSAWNPTDLGSMALPPCHVLFQFNVTDGKLSCAMYQRSGDMGLGVPFNIASYSLLTILVAHLTGLQPGEFVHFLGDAHVYLDHVDSLRQQIQRPPRAFPKLFVSPKGPRTEPEHFQYEDFELVGYDPHPAIKMNMSA